MQSFHIFFLNSLGGLVFWGILLMFTTSLTGYLTIVINDYKVEGRLDLSATVSFRYKAKQKENYDRCVQYPLDL